MAELDFGKSFAALTGFPPLSWQSRLFSEYFEIGRTPGAVDIPTGLGKTAVMALWLIAQARGAKLPRRLVYVVDRRAVVDQATEFAELLREKLDSNEAADLKKALNLGDRSLPISTLRGQHVDNREWLEDPASPAIIVGTVDMVGSRLLFEGYGVSPKMRPYHAGLLGADTLVVLDEAHLVPPFEKLLEVIEGGSSQFAARAEADRKLIPPFKLLSLSATGRERAGTVFRLEGSFTAPAGQRGDLDDPEVEQRLKAKKGVTILPANTEALEDALATQAWALAENGKAAIRCIVYCDRRDIATAVKERIEAAAKGNKQTERSAVDIHPPELFVGARRIRERGQVAAKLKELGFIAGGGFRLTKPAFLVATSAGEVGVDLDADHLVCDLVAWERMVQRLGRVNRRGKGNAKIVVVLGGEEKPTKAVAEALQKAESERTEKDTKAVEAFEEKRKTALAQSTAFLRPFNDALRQREDGLIDGSPGALRELKIRARQASNEGENLRRLLDAATTRPPLRPALTRALADAWSMTSLPEHTGRPEVEPWLRGWVKDEPQTTVTWRRYLPVRSGQPASKKEIEEFFEAAPLHVSETLETESYRVMSWLQARVGNLDAEWKPDVVGMLLGLDGKFIQALRLPDIPSAKGTPDNEKKKFQTLLSGKTLVMDARFGGLDDGLLKEDANHALFTADGDESWTTTDNKAWIGVHGDTKPVIRFRILERGDESDEAAEESWRENLRFALERSADGEATRWLSVQKWRDTSNTENDRAQGRPQTLIEHQSWTAERAVAIGRRLDLPPDYRCALGVAGGLHDEGKKGRSWKRAFHVERYATELGIPGQALAKTPRFTPTLLEDYRHEFGSLPYAKDNAQFKNLSPEMQDLVLHLIAAHHGFARPLISTKGCEDAPPSVLEERAREVALRFARLQKRWGPWGLAWWEALLRAADVQASRANDEAGRRRKENN